MNFKRYSSTLAASAAILFASVAHAQDVVPFEFPQETNFVGLGLFGVPDYYGSRDSQGVAAPLARYTFKGQRYVQLLGPELKLNLIDSATYRAGPVLRTRARRDDDVDDPIVQRMRPIPSATELGLFGAYHVPLDRHHPLRKFVFSGDIVFNTNGVYDGATGNLRVDYVHPFRQTLAGRPVIGNVGLGVFFSSDSFNRKYFGVSGSDLALYPQLGGREFRPGSTITSVKIPFGLTTHLDKRWLVSLAGRYERLLDDPKDSPVVDQRGDASQWVVGVAVTYLF